MRWTVPQSCAVSWRAASVPSFVLCRRECIARVREVMTHVSDRIHSSGTGRSFMVRYKVRGWQQGACSASWSTANAGDGEDHHRGRRSRAKFRRRPSPNSATDPIGPNERTTPIPTYRPLTAAAYSYRDVQLHHHAELGQPHPVKQICIIRLAGRIRKVSRWAYSPPVMQDSGYKSTHL